MLTFKVQVEYRIGDTVFVKTDTNQLRNIVTGYLCTEKDVQYEVRLGEAISYFYGFELSAEEDAPYRMNNS